MPPQAPKFGEVQDGFMFLGGNPADKGSWVPKEQAKNDPRFLTGQPNPNAPITPGVGAEPTTKSRILPALATASMVPVPGLGEAAAWAFPRFAVAHPALTRLGVGALTGAAGAGIGEAFGRPGTGALLGAGWGLGAEYLGTRMGGDVIRGAENRLINEAAEGLRPETEVPPRLQPRLQSAKNAIRRAYVQKVVESGETPEMLKIPTGLRNSVQNMLEERVKNIPELPNLVQTPEQLRAGARLGEASKARLGEMKSEAQVRGMAHAAGRARPMWVPAKRSASTAATRIFKLQ